MNQERSRQGLRHRGGDGGDASPPNFESAGDNPPHFQENSGPNPLSFWYGISEENSDFAAAWSPSPPFSSAWRSPWQQVGLLKCEDTVHHRKIEIRDYVGSTQPRKAVDNIGNMIILASARYYSG